MQEYVRSGLRPDTPLEPDLLPMAIYHLSCKPPLARAEGRSSTAAVAYRAGIAIRDVRTGELFDYRRRRGVIDSRLVLPGGAPMGDRPAFWNAVELHHRRRDAITSREIIVALPAEISEDDRAALAYRFAHAIATEFGVAVDCALHRPSAHGDDRNFHAHLMLSACHVSEDGSLGKKAVRLDPIACRRSGNVDSVAWLRPHWEDLVNQALSAANSSVRVDHRSFKTRGVDRLPTVHCGPLSRGARQRVAINLQVKRKNRLLEKIETEIEELRSNTRGANIRTLKPSSTTRRKDARRRLDELLNAIVDAQERYAKLPAVRCYDKVQLRRLIHSYRLELGTLTSELDRANANQHRSTPSARTHHR